jgi:site-specific DNA-methyltransferase (adenine-specific)
VKLDLHFSSKSDLWTTPQSLFDQLNHEFNFTLDPCCTEETHKCKKYYTPKEDGLSQSWEGETVFVNPPYSRKEMPKWIHKCHDEHKAYGITIVMLIPAKTETIAFHRYIYKKAELRFIKGRLKFGGNKNNAPFPSMLVIFKLNYHNEK